MIYIDFYTTAYEIYRSVRPLDIISKHIYYTYLGRSLAITLKSPIQDLKSNILSEISKFPRSIKKFLEYLWRYFFLRSFVMKNGLKIMLLDVLLMFSVDQLYRKSLLCDILISKTSMLKQHLLTILTIAAI